MLLGAGVAALCAGAAACGGGGSAPSATSPGGVQQNASGGHIDHIVIVVQENRSFDNLFHGFPGADTVSVGKTRSGTVPLAPMPLEAPYFLAHARHAALTDVDGGKMDGFEANVALPRKHGVPVPPYPQYVYVPPNEVAPYWAMAKWGVLADRFFGVLDGSFVAHQFLIAGQSGSAVDVPAILPWGCDSRADNRVPVVNAQGEETGLVYPCFDYRTLGDELDDAGVSWRYYASAYGSGGYIWSAYDAIRHVRFTPLWSTHVISPETRFAADVAAGDLAQVTWVAPSGATSDHVGSTSALGPAWVSSLVNAVGTSRFWRNTVVVVLWDDWGGVYDHVAPPAGDAFGPGIRVPLLVLSPYALHGVVAHTTYTFGSVMRLVEDTFRLARLTAVDRAAASFGADVFDDNQTPRAFGGPYAPALQRGRALRAARSAEPPDEE